MNKLSLLLFLVFTTSIITFAENTKNDEAIKLHNEGLKLFKKEKYDLSFKAFSKETSLRKKNKDYKGEALAHIYASSSLQELKKHSKAIKHLKTSLNLGLQLKNYNIIGTCYGMLGKSYRAIGNNLKADEYFTNFKNFEDHVENKVLKNAINKSTKNLKAIESELEETEENLEETAKELEVAETIAETRKMKLNLSNKEKQMQEMKLDKQKLTIRQTQIEMENEKLIRNSMIGGIVFMILILVLAFFGYQQKRKDNLLIKSQKEKIEDSINYALQIQNALLPDITHINKYLKDCFVLFKPVSIVSGDFYFFSDEDDEGAVYLAAVDCTGHGVPGAMMSMIAYNSLNEIVSRGEKKVNIILDQLHLKIVKALKQESNSNKDGVDIALCRIDLKNNSIDFSGARNPLVYIQDNKLEVIKADKRPIGGLYKRPFNDFTMETFKVDKPTMFYIFSDGYADQFDADGAKKMYAKNMYKFFEKIQHEPMEKQKALLDENFEDYRGGYEQIDDVCVIGFRMG